MQTIVALDLETTGLNPERDAVIEIGAVRFQGKRIEATWQELINPGRPLPSFITQLTGINDAMLAEAPRFSSIIASLSEFVGDRPILGQNIGFDLSFLRKKGLFLENLALDTYDLAAVLMPTAGRYSLRSLASNLGVIPGTSHRAFEDAKTVHQVYLRLLDMVEQLPLALLEEIVRMGSDIEWGAGSAFEEVLDRRETNELLSQELEFFRPEKEERAEQLVPNGDRQTIDVEEIAAVLEPGGLFSKAFSGYEHRSQQITMLRAVAQALDESRHLIVEAGTGTGKSLAYLIPAFAWAEKNNERVVISTNTLNLQDQLFKDDIPAINRVMGTQYRSAILKGRSNYLCPRRFTALRRLGPRSVAEIRVLAKIMVWLHQGGSGDRNEINLNGFEEFGTWLKLSSDSEDCTAEKCSQFGSAGCPYFIARQKAESAHVVIVNHALLLADISTGNRVIPDYNYLIVDEAHHLESATTNGLSFRVSQAEFARLLGNLTQDSPGLLHGLLVFGRKRLQPTHVAELEKLVQRITKRSRDASILLADLFGALSRFLSSQREDRPIGLYGQQERIVPAIRTIPDWTTIEVAWENLRQPLVKIIDSISQVSEGLLELSSGEEGSEDDLLIALRTTGRSLEEIFQNLEEMIFEPDSKIIYWLQLTENLERITLHAAPLEIGHLVEKHLWNEKDAIIMTSATLTTAGEFDYIRQRLGAFDAEELLLGSPFDFENSTLLYLVNDIPEPADGRAYQRAVEGGILQLVRASRGRALILFTSFAQLRRTSRAISDRLVNEGILVFEQGEGASRHALLETFKNSDQAILLGTRSYWEGIDIPGKALSVLVIVRLPFDVPNDPIIAARAETYEMPFDQYTVPEAILRFRQGFGRLIRTRSDRGVVAIFDRRILSKRYGRAFIDSLPHCTTRTSPMADLPEETMRWLGD
ncbi:MAG: DEAD/DEAH box helicase [Chloroflexi bacterium]|nr:DEAD/DEAH box helicase [Chloroflexota bacterium]